MLAIVNAVVMKQDFTDGSDERLRRALTAFLRQEVQAPASAVTDFLDMIIEDARAAHSEEILADLGRMRSASAQLNAFVKSLIQEFVVGSQGGRGCSRRFIAACATICARRSMPSKATANC